MSDPHIKSKLSIVDYILVTLYRAAYLLAAFLMFLLPFNHTYAMRGMLVVALIAATCVHIYNQKIRVIIQAGAIFAISWTTLGLWQALGYGVALMVFAALAVKEYYCFRLKAVLALPIVLALSWSLTFVDLKWLASLCHFSGAFLFAWIAYLKIKQPYHFDIGSKQKYQI